MADMRAARRTNCFLLFLTMLMVGQLIGCAGGNQKAASGLSDSRNVQQVAASTQSVDLMVDAGGHKLHMLLMGKGSPTIVFEAGFSDSLQSWSSIQLEASKHTRTVSYDRAGLGKSEPSLKPRSAGRIAAELRTALSNAGAAPPYLLAGHSAGGLFQTVFAGTYPEDVVGLVLVDPATPDSYDRIQKAPDWAEYDKEFAKLPPGDGRRGQFEALEESKEEMRRIQSLPDTIRVSIITAMQPTGSFPFETTSDMEAWKNSHEALLKIGNNAVHVVDEHSDHATILQSRVLLDVISSHLNTETRH